MRHWRSGALGCLVVLWVGGLDAVAQPLTDRLPASTMVYVGWSPNAALQTTATAKMLADERFMAPWRRLFQDFMLEMPDGPDGGERISPHLPALLMDAAQCEGCFALLEIKQAKRHFNPQSVLMIDLGAKRKTFEEHFRPIQMRLKARIGDRLKMVKLGNSWVFTKPDREGKAQLTWGFIGDTFVAYVGDGAESFVPKLVAGKIEANLKSAPAFADCMSKIPGDSIFTSYLDAQGSLTMVRKLIEQEGNNDLIFVGRNWDALLGEFGLDNVKAVGEKTVIEDKQFVTRTLVRTDGAPKGLLSFIAQQPVDESMMKVIPDDAMAAGGIRFDPAKAYDQVKASAIKLGGGDAKQTFAQLEQGAQAMGLPLNDVLQSMGDQYVIYNASSQGGFALTGWTMVGNIRDAQKFNKSLEVVRSMIAKTFGGEGDRSRLRVIDVDGQRIEYLELRNWAPIVPAWAVVGDKFVLAFYPQLVEDAVRHVRDGGKSLLDNPEFVAARKRTGNEGPMVWVNGPEITKNVYPAALIFVSAINNFGFGIRDEDENHLPGADLLPSMQRLLQYVGHDTLAIKATPDGVLKTRTVTNPLLSPLAWADSPVIWLALGIPSIGAAEETEDRTKSADNLRQIGQAVQIYSAGNNGKFPADLATLTKGGNVQAEALKSPYGPAKDGNDIVLVNYGGLNPMGRVNGGNEIIIAFDQAAVEQSEGTNALYADGHVQWLDQEAFKKSLDVSRKKIQLQNAQP